MATPIVAGAIALLLEAKPMLSNKEIKIKLKQSANDLGLAKEQQGWGMLDIKRLFD